MVRLIQILVLIVARHNFDHVSSVSKQPREVVVQSDNKILLAYKDLIFRFLPDGQLDLNFANAGYIQPVYAKDVHQPNDQTPLMNFLSVKVQPNDKILISSKASFYSAFAELGIVERYNSNGQLDSTFADNGILLVDFNKFDNSRLQYFRELTIYDEDGGFIVSGNVKDTINGEGKFAMCKYLPNGDIDTSFGNNGIVISEAFFHSTSDSIDCLWNVLVQSNGKIILQGSTPHFSHPTTLGGQHHSSLIMNRYYGESNKGDLTNVENMEVYNNLEIYPNPANDVLYINSDKQGLIEIYDIKGKLIISKIVSDKKTVIESGFLNSGMYLVKFTDNEGSIDLKKVIKY